MAGLVKRGLEEEGIAVDVAGRGEDAVWMAGSTEYDAVVLDVMLPGLDGFEVCRRLRADEVWTPVLMLTARDAVEAGERLGFLPGDIQAKVDPYLRPLFDALFDMLDPDRVNGFLERGVIEVAPLAFMRGRSLNDSFIILDEAQNTSPEQMKMFLTRLGFNSKMVVTGDVTQIDLPTDQRSGLKVIGDILEGIEDIAFVRFGGEDVVRHKLVQRIVAAYDSYQQRKR